MSNASGSSFRKVWRPTLYTFAAVFVVILVVGTLAVPAVLDLAEGTYLDLASDNNERQAQFVTEFLRLRLAAGVSREQVIAEFQRATAGTGADRGYVCLIAQNDVRYLSHPNLEQLGMDVKPGALFDPSGGEAEAPWNNFIRRGETASGHLSYGPRMAQEMVYFTNVPGSEWTVSTHQNLSRIDLELDRLRRWLIAGSLLLSLAFAVPASTAARIVNQRLDARARRQAELEHRLLEEENARKSQELEKARELQISLLPHELPTRPDVEIAASMQTATEVGGDYYDVIERDDDSVILALGDATGHGLEAGMIVVAVKSLLAYSADEDDLVGVARRMARVLRTMRLGRLNMAFALMRLSGRTLETVGAGMPPALIHRSSSGQIEEVNLSGAPLGSGLDFPYSVERTMLESGDTVLLMSDGLPELRRRDGTEVGYAEVKRCFRSCLEQSPTPQDIVARLAERVSGWREDELEDDVTLMVLQARARQTTDAPATRRDRVT